MKIENIKKVNQLVEKVTQLDLIIRTIDNRIALANGHESDGGVSPHGAMYNLHLNEWPDGSGFAVDLTGLQIGLPILEFVRDTLKVRREELMDVIVLL